MAREREHKDVDIRPERALRTIPLSALDDGGQFLIERYAIATTPAITLVGSFGRLGSIACRLAV